MKRPNPIMEMISYRKHIGLSKNKSLEEDYKRDLEELEDLKQSLL